MWWFSSAWLKDRVQCLQVVCHPCLILYVFSLTTLAFSFLGRPQAGFDGVGGTFSGSGSVSDGWGDDSAVTTGNGESDSSAEEEEDDSVLTNPMDLVRCFFMAGSYTFDLGGGEYSSPS